MTDKDDKGRLAAVLTNDEAQIVADWVEEQMSSTTSRSGRIKEGELKQDCTAFLRLLRGAAQSGGDTLTGSGWTDVREMLTSLSRSRALQGFSPSETAMFVLSLKRPLFNRLREALKSKDTDLLLEEVWRTTTLIDQLSLLTTEAYQKGREEVILRQQEEMLELSTPVVKLWDGILALPLIGTLDSARTQVVMESLLQAIVDTGSDVAIIDITGVPTVDTLVSQHLLKTVAAARLMGADCIISGIRPQIAQTIVHLGVDLSAVSTKSSLAEAFILALQRTGRSIGRIGGAGGTRAGPRV